jgi:hypothetical protein
VHRVCATCHYKPAAMCNVLNRSNGIGTDVLQHVVLLDCSVAAPAGCCVLAACTGACMSRQQVQPGLFDRLDTSTDTQMSTDMPCISCRSCRSDAAVLCHLPVVVLLLCAQGLCNMSLARQVQPGLFDRLDTSQQIHRCLLICLASRVGHAGRMLLSSAICRLLCLLLLGFVQHVTAARQVQPGLFDRLDTSQQMHRCLLVCLESRAGHASPCSCLLLSAGCCAVAAQGFVQHVNTGGYRLQVCFTDQHIKTIVLGNSSVLLSSYCADAAVYGLFCSEYCCMHRVCASRKSDRY